MSASPLAVEEQAAVEVSQEAVLVNRLDALPLAALMRVIACINGLAWCPPY